MLLRRRHRQAEPVEVSAPTGSAKKAEWYAYAVHVGVSVEDLEGLTTDQIKEAVAAAIADQEADKAAAKLVEREAAEQAEREAAEAKAKEEAEAKAAAEANTPTE